MMRLRKWLVRGAAGALAVGVFALAGSAGASPAGQRFDRAWDAYATRSLLANGRIVDRGHADQRTTSEGQAYALFFALVANERARFNKILAWTTANLAQGDLSAHLPAWLWGKRKDGAGAVLDPHAASDADVWLAYDLLQAGRLWHDPAYTQLARTLAAHIAAASVRYLSGIGATLIPGPVGFGPDPNGCYKLNPSYTPLVVMQGLATAFGGAWAAVTRAAPTLLSRTSYNGFAVDWAQWCPAAPSRTAPVTPRGSYDAIRTYLWAGITPGAIPGAESIVATLSGMADYVRQHGAPPEIINVDTGKANHPGPEGFAAAVIPLLQRMGYQLSVAHQRARVLASCEPDGSCGQVGDYYSQNLTLFALGYLSGAYRFDASGQLRVRWQQEGP